MVPHGISGLAVFAPFKPGKLVRERAYSTQAAGEFADLADRASIRNVLVL